MTNESFIILSGDTPEEKRTDDLKTVLNLLRIPFIPVKGMYNGVEEDAVLIYTDYIDTTLTKILAQKFKQESILVNNYYGVGCSLEFVGYLPSLDLGYFVEISPEDVHYHQSWSLINGKYYTTEVENG